MGRSAGTEAVKVRLYGSLWLSSLILACVAAVVTEARGAVVTVTQLTAPEAACSYLSPQLSGDGKWVAAVSICPPEAQDQDHRVMRMARVGGHVQMLTPPGYESLSPTLSNDGQRVVFLSNADLVPGQNLHHLEQVFLFDALAPRYTQITHIAVNDMNRMVGSPRISGNGDTVVFVSNADLVPGRNQDGNLELFVFDRETGQLLQGSQTESPASHQSPRVSHDGQMVVFLGIHPPFGERPHTGVYYWNRQTGAVQRLVDTPHPDAGAFGQLTISSTGNRIVFSGRYDLLGENIDRNIELFTLDIPTATARQLTHAQGCTSAHPALSSDGLRLLFVSNCRFDKLNSERETSLFLMRLDTDEIVQLTEGGNIATVEPPTMDESSHLAALAIGAELPGMVNPNRLLQLAILPLPPMDRVVEPTLRVVTADNVSSFLVSRYEPDTLYVSGMRIGVMKSQDGGRWWRLASFGLGSEAVTCLVEHGDQPGLLFAGTLDAGVYKTIDSGGLWAPANSGLVDQRIRGLAIDPVYPNIVYADTPTGLYWSTDQGERWERVTDRVTLRSDFQEGSPVRLTDRGRRSHGRNTLVPIQGWTGRLVRLSEAGLFLLSGDGAQWIQIKTPHLPQWAVAGPKGAPVFVGTSAGVYRADQLEGDWIPVSGLPAASPPLTFGPGGTVYAVMYRGIDQSFDHGLTWTRRGNLEGVAWLMPETSTTAMLFAAMENGDLTLSHDGGLHWSPLTIPAPSPHGIQSVLIKPAQ